MPKILYIEDEITKNIGSIKKFFGPILKDKRIYLELDKLENSDRVCPEDIISACRYNSVLDIAYTFPLALERIVTNHKSYDLILIDRNLCVYQYAEEVEQILFRLYEIGMDFDADRLSGYHEREGDLLLLVLLRIKPEYKDKVYYLTANTRDNLKISSDLLTTIDLGNYQKDHIIEKGSEAESTISNILADMDSFRIHNQYRRQCVIIRNHLSEKDVDEFVDIVKYHKKDNRKEFVFCLRKLLDNLLHSIAFTMAEPDAGYWDDKSNKKQLRIKSFLKGFKSGNTSIGLPTYESKHHIGYESIIRNACLSIFEICSDYGVHELSNAIDVNRRDTESLSIYTMNTLLNQICDVICWYDEALRTIHNLAIRSTNQQL